MNGADQQFTEGLRRAALTLHALTAEDRDWLLRQLPPAHGQALEPLLEELKVLGIPQDQSLVQAALRSRRTMAEPDLAQAQALYQALSHEDPVLQGQLLSLLAAEQRSAVLACWPAEVLRPTPLAMPSSWSPALQEALLQAWINTPEQELGA